MEEKLNKIINELTELMLDYRYEIPYEQTKELEKALDILIEIK